MVQNIQALKGLAPLGSRVAPATVPGSGFAQTLDNAEKKLVFSAHAQSRLTSRNLSMSQEMMESLTKAVDGAEKKGAKDSLVLLKGMAFIVNIPNRTVITAMDGRSMKDNIVTNIDSTVIAD